MFCPVCHAEFIPGVTVCDECGVALVNELPAEPRRGQTERGSSSAGSPAGSAAAGEPRSVELVTVFSSGDSGLVALVKSVFASAGISCVSSGGVFGGGGVVRVGRDDVADAQAVLAELDRSAGGDDEWDEDDADETDREQDEDDTDEEQGDDTGDEWDEDDAEESGEDGVGEEGLAAEADGETRPDGEEGRAPTGPKADELATDANAPSPPSAPTPPPGVDPPTWRA